jgi:hypothetical protein
VDGETEAAESETETTTRIGTRTGTRNGVAAKDADAETDMARTKIYTATERDTALEVDGGGDGKEE